MEELKPTSIDMKKFNRERKKAMKLPPEERLKAMGIYSIKNITTILERLRLRFCDDNHTDEEDNKITCKEGYLKRYYKKERCSYCEEIDNELNTLISNKGKED